MPSATHSYTEDEKRKILLELRYISSESDLCQKWSLSKAQLKTWKTAFNFKYLSGTFRDLVIVGLRNGAHDIPALIGYLDYLDHCVYTAAEIEAALRALREEGIALNEGEQWSYNPAHSNNDTSYIF